MPSTRFIKPFKKYHSEYRKLLFTYEYYYRVIKGFLCHSGYIMKEYKVGDKITNHIIAEEILASSCKDNIKAYRRNLNALRRRK